VFVHRAPIQQAPSQPLGNTPYLVIYKTPEDEVTSDTYDVDCGKMRCAAQLLMMQIKVNMIRREGSKRSVICCQDT